jgi:3-dehydroquinate synthase
MRLDILEVALGSRSYPIHVGSGLLTGIGEGLQKIHFPHRVAVVSNPLVAGLYSEAVTSSLQQAGFDPRLILVPDGEDNKNLSTLERIYDQLIEQRFDRGCGLLALGGGVIGDMAGFAAATFLRGIPLVQVPTTLLSQVDSSVGGKTAVNHPRGKNLIGAFYQPQLVVIDVATLQTLDPREVSAGLAEVIKYGVIRDATFFAWLENHQELLRQGDPAALIYAIKKSCQIKADIVEIDERENSIRAHLNYGHTFGHAIENLAGYGQWKHGEAVAVGMVVAAKIACNKGLCGTDDVVRLEHLLRSVNLPVVPPDYSLTAYVDAMLRDKKVKQGALTMVLNQGIGSVVLEPVADLAGLLSTILSLKG